MSAAPRAWLVAIVFLAVSAGAPGCGDDDGDGAPEDPLADPTLARYAPEIIPFAWDWEGADRNSTQLLGVAATERHVAVVYPPAPPDTGLHVAWAGVDAPWQSEALADRGMGASLAVDAAVGPDGESVHVIRLQGRDRADPAPILFEHVVWRAGEGVVLREDVPGAPVAAEHVDRSAPDLTMGVRRSGHVDVLYTLADVHELSGRAEVVLYHAVRDPDGGWQTQVAMDESWYETADDMRVGLLPRLSYDHRDLPVVISGAHLWQDASFTFEEQLILGDDGLTGRRLGTTLNPITDNQGSRSMLPFFGDVAIDPDFGWVYSAPFGRRMLAVPFQPDAAIITAGIRLSSFSPMRTDEAVGPHVFRDDLTFERLDGTVFVGGKLLFNECKGPHLWGETVLAAGGLPQSLAPSRGSGDNCVHARRAPVRQVRLDPEVAAIAVEGLHGGPLEASLDDPLGILLRHHARIVYAHGHRPYEVGVAPYGQLVVVLGGHEVDRADAPAWPGDDLLRIVESEPEDGARDVPTDLTVRVRVTGQTGQRDRLWLSAFDLVDGQPVADAPLEVAADDPDVLEGRLEGLAPGTPHRLALYDRSDGERVERRLHEWQYVDAPPPVLSFTTAGELPTGSVSPDLRGALLTFSCDFCEPEPSRRLPPEPPAQLADLPRFGVDAFEGVGDAIDQARVRTDEYVLTEADGTPVPGHRFHYAEDEPAVVRLQWFDALAADTEYRIGLPETFRTVHGRRPTAEQRTLRFRTAP